MACTQPLLPYGILYVDDHPADVALMRDFAEHLGDVFLAVATTPEEATQLARELQPALVIVDVDLDAGREGGDGGNDGGPEAVLSRIRAIPATRDVPVIALSASVHPRERERARHAGAGWFLTKPLDLGALAAAIQAART